MTLMKSHDVDKQNERDISMLIAKWKKDCKIRDEYLLLNNNVKCFCGLMDQFMVYLKCFKSISKFKLDINSRIWNNG